MRWALRLILKRLLNSAILRHMIDIEGRLRKTFSAMAGNEALSDVPDENTAALMLKWSEEIAERFVRQTSDMEDEAAEEFLAAPLGALRKMMRAIGRWSVESDPAVRQEWWARIGQQVPVLYGVGVVLPETEMIVHADNLPGTLAALKNSIETQISKG